MSMRWPKNKPFIGRTSYLMGYLYNENHVKSLLGITVSSFDFTKLTDSRKNTFLNSIAHNKISSSGFSYLESFFSSANNSSQKVILKCVLFFAVTRFTNRIIRIFVPKFYHDRKDTTFLRGLQFVGEKSEIDEAGFSEFSSILVRKLYEYRLEPFKAYKRVITINPNDLDWPFPDKYYSSIGYTVNGFNIKFRNLPYELTRIIDPSPNLINTETNTEVVDNNLTQKLFSEKPKKIKDRIKEYNAIPIQNFVNESFFLYDKSNTIKKTYVTAINKQLSLYGSFSYFSGKTSIKNIKLIDVNNSLKSLVEKTLLKDSLKLQIVYVNGSDVNTEDQKIHDFSIIRLGKRKKKHAPL